MAQPDLFHDVVDRTPSGCFKSMAIRSDAQKKAVAKYNAKAYVQILLRVKAGESEEIKAPAAMQGKTINGFIKHIITETMQQD